MNKKYRIPFDSDEPREEFSGHSLRMPPVDYTSIQSTINSNNGTVNEEELQKYIEKIAKKGYIHVPKTRIKKEIYNVSKGNCIKYITNDNKWRSGGFFIEINRSSSIYANGEVIHYKHTDPMYYILYKSYNNTVYSVQLDDIKDLWYLPKYDKIKKKLVVYKRPVNETKHVVYLKNLEEVDVPVFYGKDKYSVERFINSNKYRDASTYGWVFEDEFEKMSDVTRCSVNSGSISSNSINSELISSSSIKSNGIKKIHLISDSGSETFSVSDFEIEDGVLKIKLVDKI